jgi:serine/threonine protein kinase
MGFNFKRLSPKKFVDRRVFKNLSSNIKRRSTHSFKKPNPPRPETSEHFIGCGRKCKDCRLWFCYNSFVEINHSIGIGTPGYIAPEQLQGSNYNSKADMHSLGIILLELFCPGQTDSEFKKYIEDFKKFNKLPFILEDSFPDVAEIIRQLTQRDPEKRPTVSELLNTRLFLDQLIEQKKLKLQYLKQKKVLQEFVYQESIQINYLDSIHLSPPSLNYIEFESLSDRIYQFSYQSTSLFSIQSSERLESKSTMEVRYFSGIGILKFGKVIWISERKSNITN